MICRICGDPVKRGERGFWLHWWGGRRPPTPDEFINVILERWASHYAEPEMTFDKAEWQRMWGPNDYAMDPRD